jgi:hypothetical protein
MSGHLITAWDELLVHQSPAPVAEAGTSDHRFFDRIVLLTHDPDGRWAVILGVAAYKNLDVLEGFACVRDGTRQHNLRLSRSLRPSGPALDIGPLHVTFEVPLQRVRASLDADRRWPHSLDLVFTGSLPVEAEDHHLSVVHGRRSEDFVRFHQLGTTAGRLEVGDETVEPAGWFGLRDHSWGVRPGVGGFEPKAHGASAGWTAALFGWAAFATPKAAGQFELRETADGEVERIRGHVIDRATGRRRPVARVTHEASYVDGTGRFSCLRLGIVDDEGRCFDVTMTPSGRSWVFRGSGYDRGFSDGRGLGVWRGDDVVEVDEYDLTHVEDVVMAPGADPVRPRHREQPVDVVVDGSPGAGHVFWTALR